MIGFILTGHGHFSTGLKSALDMIAGPQEAFEIVTFTEDAAGAYGENLRAAVKDMREKTDGVLIFCDLMGGTPFNQSMMAGATIPGVRVVTGVNLPMLLECMSMRTDSTTAEELCQTAVEIGQMGIAAPVLETSAADEPEDGDGI